MDALMDEVESLEAILMDDVNVKKGEGGIPEEIETTVFPNVGDESEQYVCVTLQVTPTPGYPDTSPKFKLLRPRGLDDARLETIRGACITKLRESLGFPVVFDLIEVVREHLTGSNLPSGQCVICLYGFSDGDEFARTECFHYLHSYCLARHLNALRRNYQEEYEKLPAWQQKDAEPFRAGCPVCREPIKDESDSLKCAMPPAELQNAPEFRLTRELRELQKRMSSLYMQQKSRGGIIDVDADSGAVISIETEEEIRRRMQRKQQQLQQQQGNTHNSFTTANAIGGDGHGTSSNASSNSVVDGVHDSSNASEVAGAVAGGEARDTRSNGKPSSSGGSGSNNTNFAPVVQQTQRISNDPTNNNYQHQSHNRRHYRGGGRRHQHHHHHHRDRERERERHEHHNGGGSNGSNGSGGSGSNTMTPLQGNSNNTNSNTSSGNSKQPKSHAANASHCR